MSHYTQFFFFEGIPKSLPQLYWHTSKILSIFLLFQGYQFYYFILYPPHHCCGFSQSLLVLVLSSVLVLHYLQFFSRLRLELIIVLLNVVCGICRIELTFCLIFTVSQHYQRIAPQQFIIKACRQRVKSQHLQFSPDSTKYLNAICQSSDHVIMTSKLLWHFNLIFS